MRVKFVIYLLLT